MIPDSYRIRSPDSFDVHGEPKSNILANRVSIKVDANALAIVALIFSVGALVALYMQSSAQDRLYAKDQQVVDSKIAAGNAAVLEKVQESIATTQATAQAGKEHARIALDEVQRANAQLEAKGLIRGSH